MTPTKRNVSKAVLLTAAIEKIVKAYEDGVPNALTIGHQQLIQLILGHDALIVFLAELQVDDDTAYIIGAEELWNEMEAVGYYG